MITQINLALIIIVTTLLLSACLKDKSLGRSFEGTYYCLSKNKVGGKSAVDTVIISVVDNNATISFTKIYEAVTEINHVEAWYKFCPRYKVKGVIDFKKNVINVNSCSNCIRYFDVLSTSHFVFENNKLKGEIFLTSNTAAVGGDSYYYFER